MVQEAYQSHSAIRQACERHLSAHAQEVAKDIVMAKHCYAPDARWSAEGLSLHTQAAAECLGHLRRYLEMLFHYPNPKEATHDI